LRSLLATVAGSVACASLFFGHPTRAEAAAPDADRAPRRLPKALSF
jgi:hypothetical protein